MEDRHLCILDYDNYTKQVSTEHALFAVYYFYNIYSFDGHNGNECSEYLSKEFPTYLMQQPDFMKNPLNALKETFIQMDQQFISDSLHDLDTVLYQKLLSKLYIINKVQCVSETTTPVSLKRTPLSPSSYKSYSYLNDVTVNSPSSPISPSSIRKRSRSRATSIDNSEKTYNNIDTLVKQAHVEYSGSTAAVVLLRQSVLYIAHCGDSRVVLCRRGEAIDMTKDHKPFLPEEKLRIESAGGWVTNNRLNGILGVSRSFGDIEYKYLKEKSWRKKFLDNPLTVVFLFLYYYRFQILQKK